MANWYDPWLTDLEKRTLQIGQKGIRARQRKQVADRLAKGATIATVKGYTAKDAVNLTQGEKEIRNRNNRQTIEDAFKKKVKNK